MAHSSPPRITNLKRAVTMLDTSVKRRPDSPRPMQDEGDRVKTIENLDTLPRKTWTRSNQDEEYRMKQGLPIYSWDGCPAFLPRWSNGYVHFQRELRRRVKELQTGEDVLDVSKIAELSYPLLSLPERQRFVYEGNLVALHSFRKRQQYLLKTKEEEELHKLLKEEDYESQFKDYELEFKDYDDEWDSLYREIGDLSLK